ncbi:hypothetical protein Ami103574_06540 [Aminipila butyrica]|uniref:Uncharacterized protein n=1 Tax=Aminipila butyrica TaxID=433296 RepID=A0A858BSP5_9FIRM|nr:hypothetical protein [Aminipila butyrica]QIB69001.1 hypothetical protein Ami103574_06540 [Aminipila butyrica]
MAIEENKLKEYRHTLDKLAEKAEADGQLEYQLQSPEHRKWMEMYKIKSVSGRAVYESFSDDDLCEYIRNRARELDHVPTQKEVYWIYHMYIKHRFGNWPKALKQAVMSTKAGSGGDRYDVVAQREKRCQEILEEIRIKADQLHRPPHLTEMRESIDGLKYKFDTWSQVLEAAGIDQAWKNQHMVFRVPDLTEEELAMLEKIRERAGQLGRPPLRKEIEEDVKAVLKEKCKTWRNILYQIGMRPVEKPKSFTETYLDERKNKDRRHREVLSNGTYKVLSLSQKERAQIESLRELVQELGRPPIREEVPEELYTGLIKACGSYKNMLFQVGATPLGKEEAQKAKRKLKGGAHDNSGQN